MPRQPDRRAPGERLILLNHAHLDVPSSPYRATGPIFVREAATEAEFGPDCIPPMLANRLLSARAYDADTMMVEADVVPGETLDQRLGAWLANPRVETVHLHTARRGCYMARAIRAD